MTDLSETIAWLSLRTVYAWMYLYPAIGLVRDWPTTVQTTGLLFPRGTTFFAVASLVLMILGSLMILFGFYGQYAAAALVAFNLGGARVHYKLAETAAGSTLSSTASAEDRERLAALAGLAQVGHLTSAQKNYVLAAVALFLALTGTGPWSFVPSTGIF